MSDNEARRDAARTASNNQLRVETDEEQWGDHLDIRRANTAPSSPATSYTTDREMVYRGRGSGTVAETHLLRSTGVQNQSYTEEHWESEIKSFVTTAPPKFIQVIKAYRVLSTDTLTLVVEVASDPPAIFEWSCNDRPVQQDRRKFQVRHGLNITTLTVQRPEKGVYKCTARNPAGTSTSYGYITVNMPPRYQDWSVTREQVVETERVSVTINSAPRFINQVPNLTLNPGAEAVIDVEVDASPPAKFTWFVNGYEFRESSGKVHIYFPKDNRCVARFPMPVSGEYKVVAENAHGQAMSSGFVEVAKDSTKTMRPPVAPGEHITRNVMTTSSRVSRPETKEIDKSATERSDSATRTSTVNVYEVNYYQRSSSLPRGVRHLERHVEVGRSPERTPRRGSEVERLIKPEGDERPPKIIEPLHSTSFLDGQPMLLRCVIDAQPSAMVQWFKDDVNVEEWVINKDVAARVLPGGICELANPECYPEDGGLYKCVASNAYGTAETSAYIAVEGISYHKDFEEASVTESASQMISDRIILPPKFVEPMHIDSEELVAMKIIRLICRVQSAAPVQMTWMKNETPITKDTEKYEQHAFSDGVQILVLHNPTSEDNGIYTCKAESEHGLTNTSCEIIVPSQDVVEIPVVIEEKQEIPITVEVHEAARRTDAPVSQLVVEHTEAPLPKEETEEFVSKSYTDQTVQKDEEFDEVTEIKKKEEEYKLLVKVADSVASTIVANVFFDAVNEAVRIIVREVEEPQHEIPTEIVGAPKFEVSHEDYTVMEGEDVRMETKVFGNPTPFVEWYFGEQKLNVDSRTTMSYEKNVVSLTLKSVEPTLAGTYYCHATNIHGTAVLSLRVVVQSEQEDDNSQLQLTITKFTRTEDGQTIVTNVNVDHHDEFFEHKITVVEPERTDVELTTTAVVVSPPAFAEPALEVAKVHVQDVSMEPTETQVTVNVNVEHPITDVERDLIIKSPVQDVVSVIREGETVMHTEEVMQTKDIILSTEKPEATAQETTLHRSSVLMDRPQQKEERSMTIPYEEKVHILEERLFAATTVNISPVDGVNDLLNTVMALKDQHRAHETANVEVRRPAATFDHMVTVMEAESLTLGIHLNAPESTRHTFIDLETILQRPSTSHAADTLLERPSRKSANAEHRIVILEGVSNTFNDAITWSIRKVKKALGEDSERCTNAVIEVAKPGETSEQVTTIVDMEKLLPELLHIAAAASKVKIQNVTVSLVRQHDVAHQELVIEYEGLEEDETELNVSSLVFASFHSREEGVFERRPQRGSISPIEEEDNEGVVAVFVEVEASCPDQSVEIVASVSMPVTEDESVIEEDHKRRKLQAARSFSLSESTSTAAGQPPKFFRKLADKQSIPGEQTQFKCIVSGIPTPEVTWTVDGDPIQNNEEYTVICEDGVCILRINETLPEDEGEYVCQARNTAGTAHTNCFLKVLSDASMSEVMLVGTNKQHDTVMRFVQYAPSKTSLVDEQEDELDFLERHLSQMSLDRWETCSLGSRGRLVTSVSEFELFRVVNYNADLKETSAFYKYFETGHTTVRITELAQEEALEATFTALPSEEKPTNKVPPPVPPRPKPRKSHAELKLQNSEHCFCDILFKKPEIHELAKITMEYTQKKPTFDQRFCSVSEPAEDIWESQVQKHIEEAIRECNQTTSPESARPRTPDLPEKVLYRGQEIGITTREIQRPAVTSDDGDVANSVQKCVEAMFDFDVPIAVNKNLVLTEEELLKELHTSSIGESVFEDTIEANFSFSKDEELMGKITIIPFVNRPAAPEDAEIDSAVSSEVYPPSSMKEGQRKASADECTDVPWSMASSVPGSPFKETSGVFKERGRSRSITPIVNEEVALVFNQNNSSDEGVCFVVGCPTKCVVSRDVLDLSRKAVEKSVVTDDTPEMVSTGVGDEPALVQRSYSAAVNAEHEIVPKKGKMDDLLEIKRIAKQVEEELSSLSATNREKTDEARELEATIIKMAEELAKNTPVSEAQAEAKEELLRATLANLILYPRTEEGNIEQIPSERDVKSPIQAIRDHLDDIELSLMDEIPEDAEVQNIIKASEVPAPGVAKPPTPSVTRTRARMKKIPTEELMRMTPLTTNIRDKLNTLESMIEEASREEIEEAEEATQSGKKGLHKPKPQLHDLFVQINREIATIKGYCSKRLSQKGTEAVAAVLHKVGVHITSIINLMQLSRERRKKGEEEIPVKEKDAISRMSFVLRRKEQTESAYATVIFRSISTNSHSEATPTTSTDGMRFSYEYKTVPSSVSMSQTMFDIEEASSEGEASSQEETLQEEKCRTESIRTPIPPPRRRRTLSAEQLPHSAHEQERTSITTPTAPRRKKWSKRETKTSKAKRSFSNDEIHAMSSPTNTEQPNDSEAIPVVMKEDISNCEETFVFTRNSATDELQAIVLTTDKLSEKGSNACLMFEAAAVSLIEGTSKIGSRKGSVTHPSNSQPASDIMTESWTTVITNRSTSECLEKSFEIVDAIDAAEPGTQTPDFDQDDPELVVVSSGDFKVSDEELAQQPARPMTPPPDHRENFIRQSDEDIEENITISQDFQSADIADASVAFEVKERRPRQVEIPVNRSEFPEPITAATFGSNEMMFLMETRDSSVETLPIVNNPISAEETTSMQLVCEESDYGTDTENSGLLRGAVATFRHGRSNSSAGTPKRTSLIRTPECENIHEEVLEEMEREFQKLDRLMFDDTPDEQVLLEVVLSQKSDSLKDEDVEEVQHFVRPDRHTSTDSFDLQQYVVDESDLNSASEALSVSERAPLLLSTITERTEQTDPSSTDKTKRENSEDTMHVVIDEKALSQMDSSISPEMISPCTIRETDILSDEELTEPLATADTTQNFALRKRPQRAKLTAAISPDVRMFGSARISPENTFDVVIQQEPEEFLFTVTVYDEIIDFTFLTIVADDFSERAPSLCANNFDDFTETSSFEDFDELREYSPISDQADKIGVTVSILARSMHDIVYAELEEIPWGEVAMTVPLPENNNVMITSQDSDSKMSSVQFNVTVSESKEHDKKKNLKSQESFRSSRNSFVDTDRTESALSLNIPSYVIKLGATATITCELNSYLPPDSHIEWMKGQHYIDKRPGKVDRISHDLLEVLVIGQVSMEDTDMYSLVVNDETFPVAYLVVEENPSEEIPTATFLSPSQTLFVMDGQTSVLSVQISDPQQSVVWYKERKLLTENSRTRFENTQDGTKKIIFEHTNVSDQGTYYAYLGESYTAITLVVEEKIDEREVTVVASGTESDEDDLREYLVPPGSTATIACEMEESEVERELVWIKDSRPISFGNEAKVEHVINGLKHYLVIHDTEPIDSGLYSVSISGSEFRVAHLAVNDLATSNTGFRRKRISKNSIH